MTTATQPPLVPTSASGLAWIGEIPPQKWMNFYTKVLTKFAASRGLQLTVKLKRRPKAAYPSRSSMKQNPLFANWV